MAADMCKKFAHTASFVLQIAKQLICGHLPPDHRGGTLGVSRDQHHEEKDVGGNMMIT